MEMNHKRLVALRKKVLERIIAESVLHIDIKYTYTTLMNSVWEEKVWERRSH